MKKKRLYLVLGVLLIAAVGGAAWQALRPVPKPTPEPGYHGFVFLPRANNGPQLRVLSSVPESHPLSFWLTNEVIIPDKLRVGDSNAVPFLVRALKRDSWFGAAVYRKQVWPHLPTEIQKHLPPPPVDNQASKARATAAELLGQMGPMAKPAIPALIRTSRGDDNRWVRENAALALGNLGGGDRAAMAALTEAFSDKDEGVRLTLINFILPQMDPEAATEAAVRMLKDTNANVRQLAVSVLGQVGKKHVNAIAALVEALENKEYSIRAAATNLLWWEDPEAAAKAGVKKQFP
jgi:HEAT repeat protein